MNCPICEYPVAAERCPECGSALLEQTDEQLLRRLPALERRQLRLGIRLLVGAPFLALATVAAFLVLLVASMIADWEALAEAGTLVLMLGLILALLAWFGGGWMIARAGGTRRPGLARRVGAASVITCASIVGYLLAPTFALTAFACLTVVSVGALVWTHAEVCAVIWDSTRRARYSNGLRQPPAHLSLLAFKAMLGLWMVLAFGSIVLAGMDTSLANALDGLASALALLLVIFGALGLVKLGGDIRDELSADPGLLGPHADLRPHGAGSPECGATR